MGAPMAPQMNGGSTTLYYRNVRRNGFYLQDLAQQEKDGCPPYPSFYSHLRTLQYASAQALVSHPWRPSYYRSDRSTMPMSNKIILRSSSTLSLCSPYIRISSNFFQAVANKIPFFFLFLAMLACSWRVSRIAHFVVLTLFGESITRKVRIPIKRFW